jgi:predicted RNA-binding Zn ribbon-like protein
VEATPAPAASPGDREPAPGDLRLVEDLVNTADLMAGSDELADPAALGAWLAGRGLVPAERPPVLDHADVARVHALREALRDVLGANSGDDVDPEASALLERESTRAGLRVRIDAEGMPRLEPAGEGLDGAIARMLAAVATAGVEGTWRRLKACGDHACRWAFYDRSRNGAGTWCSMATCGNRAKARRHRTRSRGGHEHS